MTIRKIWLENPDTREIWDLLPKNPHLTSGGCAFLDIAGVGYKQNVEQEQVEVDYFISAISSANNDITGNLYFNGDEHLENFQNYIGDFRKQFLLYYSPSGEYEPYDRISSPYYKKVTISEVQKTEKDQFGWYVCACTLSTQSDVWKRDVYYEIDGTEIEETTDVLVYPYKYTYVIGGNDIFEIEIENGGRETGCVIQITNNSGTSIGQIEWFLENTYEDYYGVEQTTVQRSKWYTTNTDVRLQDGYSLYVDSNPITQEARVDYTDGTSQSVVKWQEPSWDYINFVRIKHGTNRLVFYMEQKDVTISVLYQEQKELI